MQNNQRAHEGYLLIDHRESPGISPEQANAAGLPSGCHRGMVELPTYTCSHCCAVVVMNPQRTRDRAFCTGCNRYICDTCGAIRAQTNQCVTYQRVMDEAYDLASKSQ